VLTGDSPALARASVRDAIEEFRRAPHRLNLSSAADLLSEDLRRLCDEVAAAGGAPFGAHTRAVLLCDNVHDWTSPVTAPDAPPTAVGALLKMIGEFGLGTGDRPMPVIMAGSKTDGAGAELKAWAAKGNSGYLVQDLTPFDEDDMTLGWQWVLLHPAMGPARQRYGPLIHTVRPASWDDYLTALYEWVGERPGEGSRQVYRLPRGNPKYFDSSDDEQAWTTYVKLHPEAQR
jgi:hypothetical protein